jgi:hypothetical protein
MLGSLLGLGVNKLFKMNVNRYENPVYSEIKDFSVEEIEMHSDVHHLISLISPPHPDGMGCTGALVVWAYQLGCLSMGRLGAMKICLHNEKNSLQNMHLLCAHFTHKVTDEHTFCLPAARTSAGSIVNDSIIMMRHSTRAKSWIIAVPPLPFLG